MITIRRDRRNKRAFVSVDNATARNQRGLRRALFEIGKEHVNLTVKLILQKNKKGRLYRFRGRLHRASAPGQAPANMTGALANSVGYKVRGHQEMEFGDEILYGKFLENGTRKMEARPHLKKTVDGQGQYAKNAIRHYTQEEVER